MKYRVPLKIRAQDAAWFPAGALLRNHSDHGWIATTCTVSSSVASQHPNCGIVPPTGAAELQRKVPQSNVPQILTCFGRKRTTPATRRADPISALHSSG